MSVALSQSIAFAIGNEDADGAPVNASSIAGTLYRNGASTAETVTVTNLTTGVYSVAFTVPSGYAVGDILQVRVVADGIGRFVWGDAVDVTVSSRNATTPPTASAIADAVWDEARTGHTTSGTFGFYLDAAISGISGGGGGLTGPYTRTITVTDSDTSAAIEGAKVRLYRTGESGTTVTNASGVASFTVEAATWSYAITANGYTGISGTIVVSANGDTAVEMDLMSVTPPDDPALCAVTFHLRDQYGADKADEPVEITFVQWESSASETPPVVSVPPVQQTDVSGLVEVDLYRDATYRIVYGSAGYTKRIDVVIPDADSYSVEA